MSSHARSTDIQKLHSNRREANWSLADSSHSTRLPIIEARTAKHLPWEHTGWFLRHSPDATGCCVKLLRKILSAPMSIACAVSAVSSALLHKSAASRASSCCCCAVASQQGHAQHCSVRTTPAWAPVHAEVYTEEQRSMTQRALDAFTGVYLAGHTKSEIDLPLHTPLTAVGELATSSRQSAVASGSIRCRDGRVLALRVSDTPQRSLTPRQCL